MKRVFFFYLLISGVSATAVSQDGIVVASDPGSINYTLIKGNGTLVAPTTKPQSSTDAFQTFSVGIAAADSVRNAGDSVMITITALDVQSTRMLTYQETGQTITLNNTTVSPIVGIDATFYFSYTNRNSGPYVQSSTGVAITDSIFDQGQAIVWLHKFTAENSANTVTVNVGRITATSVNGTKFIPLTSAGTTTWTVIASRDTVGVNNLFSYTIYPRDKYDNLNTAVTNFAYVTSNQGVNFNAGANPIIFTGPVTRNATQAVPTVAPNHLIIYVSDGVGTVFGQSKSIVADPRVSVEQPKALPTVYALLQNYPNPFNPTTNITFDIPQNSSVKIGIYDMLGREVAALVNTDYTPGHYTVPFDASKLSSGMYIYRMASQSTSGDQKLFTSTKKLMLVK